jgi:hypothetical protein
MNVMCSIHLVYFHYPALGGAQGLAKGEGSRLGEIYSDHGLLMANNFGNLVIRTPLATGNGA